MKKLTTLVTGLALAVGTVALAQEAKKPETKPAGTAAGQPAPTAKKKHRKPRKPGEHKGDSGTTSTPKPATK